MDDRRKLLKRNLERVRERIETAATQAGRGAEDVRLIAVTKYVDAELTRELFDAGCKDLGESRPQALWAKAEELSELNIRWHQIGHLQRNKLRRTLPLVSLVHSVDSLRLLDAIDTLQSEADPHRPMPILLEVNTSGDEAKHGFRSGEMPTVLETVASRQHVQLRGVMCMAGLGTSADQARQHFARLRELRDRLQAEYADQDLAELSMGMSGDFEAAIAEGATMVRVGSLLFEGV